MTDNHSCGIQKLARSDGTPIRWWQKAIMIVLMFRSNSVTRLETIASRLFGRDGWTWVEVSWQEILEELNA